MKFPILATFACIFLAFGATGCFQEQSIRMKQGDIVLPAAMEKPDSSRTTRQWLVETHTRLAPLLPRDNPPALLTDQLVDRTGKPIDVFRHFRMNPNYLQSIFTNYAGLDYTARLVAGKDWIDEQAPSWPGFESIWVPIDAKLSYSARIGYAKQDGKIRDADCIVLLPGFFGDLGALRSRDLAEALIASGLHVLAIEVRGYGQTENRYPDVAYNFGALEVADLLVVSEWVEQQPHVRRSGLIGFCWSGNSGLLAAWVDGRKENDPSLPPKVAPFYSSPSPRPHFSAGILAFSPALCWEDVIDVLETPYKRTERPVWSALQNTIYTRMVRKGYPEPNGSLRRLIEYEYRRSPLPEPEDLRQSYDFLRLAPYKDRLWLPKMDAARVPVLIVHAANDPINPAQDVADFMARTSNPNVAALILRSGGHIGFPAYARAYYFSLIANFFDPTFGPGGKQKPAGGVAVISTQAQTPQP